ncbi:hypothetical protein HBA54_24625 [Pelagibius litoralis]|uniref:Uncharacterized protein n=1 Tax=Pelagibius litoralis TaxID=374515 RepID=A0A967F2N1_9PROT|nr:hypothetical protein [Pelagibius litoralis]NIA71785.1 hypothetical protein [Pelagibius litoralis]
MKTTLMHFTVDVLTFLVYAAFAVTLMAHLAGDASAQMNEQPWGFSARSGGSMAIFMKQVDAGLLDGNSGSGSAAVSGTTTYLVCGGEGSAGARGNSSCIILNNSDGALNLGQEAVGDQTAENNVTQTQNNGADEVSEILDGDAASQ